LRVRLFLDSNIAAPGVDGLPIIDVMSGIAAWDRVAEPVDL